MSEWPIISLTSFKLAPERSMFEAKVWRLCRARHSRHTYAQNLLQIGRPIQEIKEMLGHDSIQSSGRYIQIHTELMRKVLFNETL